MTRKRSILEHPALPYWGALWLAALVGLGVMVLPDWVIGRAVVVSRIDAVFPDLLPPLDLARHVAISLAAAVVVGLVGLMLFLLVSRALRRRHMHDWNELASELDSAPEELAERMPRPLRVREELDEGFDAEDDTATYVEEAQFEACPPDSDVSIRSGDDTAERWEEAELAELVERFDRALDAFQRDRIVQADQAPSPANIPVEAEAPEPIEDVTSDHSTERAELRAALDHLARARRD